MQDGVSDQSPPAGQCREREGVESARSLSGATSLGQITASHILQFPASRQPDPNRPFRRLGAYALVYLLAGEGRFRDEAGRDTPITAGDLLLLSPTIGHIYGPSRGATWVERYVVFEGPIFDMWNASGVFDRHSPIIRLEPVDHWNTEFDHLFDNTGSTGALSNLEEISRLQLLLARALSATSRSSHTSTADETWLSRSCALLNADMDLDEVAVSMALSYDGFRKRFRKLAGVSPARYRTEQKIEKARYLIQQGTHTNARIAEMLGYYDEQHFSRRFKHVTGKSPREFRESLPVVTPIAPE